MPEPDYKQITIVNNSSGSILVKISTNESDGGQDGFFPVPAHGSDRWNRSVNQVVQIVRYQKTGAIIEERLGIPGEAVYVN
ncbi:hypothetical protein D9757_007412 [Collybiopsis confluens]|uniref:Uncharacterized protein n=1 Tax=Collybiopsis confluens TaxID=2823264 RepID=A0A8H5HIA5_9AGAR|nr:hypothetical protein D9757_007412 [Collybiopsis confluens]